MRPWFLGPHPPYLCLSVKGQSEIHKEPTTKWRGTSVQTRAWQTGVPVGKIWPTAHVYKQNFIRTPPPASIHVLSEAVLHFNAKLSNYERNCLPLKVKNIFLPGPLKKKRKIIDLRYKPRAGSLSDCVLRSLSHSFLVMGGKKKNRGSQAVEWGSLSKFIKMGRTDWRWW